MDENIGFSHVLAIVNSAAMNIGVLVSLWIRVLFEYMPGSVIAGWYGSSIYRFWETSILFSTVVEPICIPTNSVGGFPFSKPLPAFICRHFNYGHSDWYEF